MIGGILDFLRRDPDADVLVVTNMWPEPERPAYGIQVQRQVASLIAAGVRCDVLCIRGYRSPVVYPLAAAFFLWTSLSWRRRYRLVHVYAGETALAARFHLGAPMLVSYLGDDLLGDRDESGRITASARIRSALVRAHSLLFPATITMTSAMEAVLPRRSRRRNHVIPNGVSRVLFRPVDRDGARTALGWGDEPVALFASAAKSWVPAAKRRSLAQRACDLAGFRLHVAVNVEGTEMPVLMSAADCLLITSAVEGSPTMVKEALMCNLPVVATPVGDVPERLLGVDPSWLCEPDDRSLAAALQECKALGRRSNGREAAASLDEPRIAERILEVYRRVGGISTASNSAPLAAETD